jgi:hypothetical protein
MVGDETLSTRLAQFAWAIHTGDWETLQELRRVIEAGGGTWEDDGQQVWCTGPSGIRSGFLVGGTDPITACVAVSFLLVGPLWPQVPFVKKACDILNKRWRNKIKRRG